MDWEKLGCPPGKESREGRNEADYMDPTTARGDQADDPDDEKAAAHDRISTHSESIDLDLALLNGCSSRSDVPEESHEVNEADYDREANEDGF